MGPWYDTLVGHCEMSEGVIGQRGHSLGPLRCPIRPSPQYDITTMPMSLIRCQYRTAPENTTIKNHRGSHNLLYDPLSLRLMVVANSAHIKRMQTGTLANKSHTSTQG